MEHLVNRHILATKNFTKPELAEILRVATAMEQTVLGQGRGTILSDKILATLFFEQSTRTRLSFETAMFRLGGQVITVEQGSSTSVKKGETLEDMGRIVSGYADIVVMRHPEPYSVERFSTFSTAPVINAGDGPHEHPTQALVDLYTIYKDKGSLDGLHIGMLGDLKYGRTVHSLVDVLQHYSVELTFISPPELRMPREIVARLEGQGIRVVETSDLEDVIKRLDVLYATRIQQERFSSRDEYLRLKDCYQIDKELMAKAAQHMSVLHPLPRVDEIHPEIDDDPRAQYFTQAQNGIALRMALLAMVVGRVNV